MNLPLVSISCITYNHAPYLRQCLEGFLYQKCSFEYEILIYDDASTDGTQQIIKEYEKRYPNIVKPIFQTQNQYSTGVRGIMARFNFPRAQGKYIAMCEGDDYWIDPLKLQKQVDFLEKNPDYSLCFHKTKIIYDRSDTIDYAPKLDVSGKYEVSDLINKNYIQTSSVVFRNITDRFAGRYDKLPMGDWPLFLLLSTFGHLYYMKDTMSVYNNHLSGVWNSKCNSERSKARDKFYQFAIPILVNDNKRVAKLARIKNFNLLIDELTQENRPFEAAFLKLLRHPSFRSRATGWSEIRNQLYRKSKTKVKSLLVKG